MRISPIVLLLIAMAGCDSGTQPAKPSAKPAQVVPANRIERQVLALANVFIKTQKVDWTLPIKIETGTSSGKFVVTYFTTDENLELLGPRQLIVTPSAKTVEFVMRD